MPESDDITLLRQYAEGNSEAAFAALVERYVNLVYSTALRRAGSPEAADEITQAVFILLAKKAGAIGDKTILSGWLYHTAQLTSANFLRGEIRRQRREQEAHVQSVLNEPQPTDEAWRQIAPLLEDAMARLATRDRDAIVLRFFENKNLRDVGAAIGASEDAAKVRVSRALEKLRKIFARHGVKSTTAVISGAISVNSVQTAPAVLVKTISTVAMAKGATAGTSTLALVKGVLKIMAWTKAKTAVVATAGVLLATGTTLVVVKKVVAPPAQRFAWADDPRSWELDFERLNKLPAGAFIFRPTRFAQGGPSSMFSTGRLLEKDYTVGNLIGTAYGFPSTRIIFPAELPDGRFDVLATVSNNRELLQQELKKSFHLVAHRETRETDAFLLKVSNPNPPNLKPHAGNNDKQSMIGESHKATVVNESPYGLFGEVEGHMGKPVINRTGLAGHYDIQFDWKPRPGETDKEAYQRALLEQLGLQLVPDRVPIEVLVVEKSD
jgi:uncharacterized protein (TIGR03435 family)